MSLCIFILIDSLVTLSDWNHNVIESYNNMYVRGLCFYVHNYNVIVKSYIQTSHIFLLRDTSICVCVMYSLYLQLSFYSLSLSLSSSSLVGI